MSVPLREFMRHGHRTLSACRPTWLPRRRARSTSPLTPLSDWTVPPPDDRTPRREPRPSGGADQRVTPTLRTTVDPPPPGQGSEGGRASSARRARGTDTSSMRVRQMRHGCGRLVHPSELGQRGDGGVGERARARRGRPLRHVPSQAREPRPRGAIADAALPGIRLAVGAAHRTPRWRSPTATPADLRRSR